MLERFVREKQRSSKGTAFNLDDEDELTHYGQSLSNLDEFDNVGLNLDEDEEVGQIDRSTVQRSHFGGFEDDEGEDDDEDEDGQVSTAVWLSAPRTKIIFSRNAKGRKQRSWQRSSRKAKNTRYVLSLSNFRTTLSYMYTVRQTSPT